MRDNMACEVRHHRTEKKKLLSGQKYEIMVWKFYCNTSDVYFGPDLKSYDEGMEFKQFLGRDPRIYSTDELIDKLEEFRGKRSD